MRLAVIAGHIDAPITATLGGRIALVTLHSDFPRRFPRRERVFHADQVAAGQAVEWFETNIPGVNTYHVPRWSGYVTATDGETVTVERCRNDACAVSEAAAWRRRHLPQPVEVYGPDSLLYDDEADAADQAASA